MKAYVNRNGVKKEIKEVYESFNGDLYFVAEQPDADGCALGYARLYGMPDGAEWGILNIPYLLKTYGKYKLWVVKEENWTNINSYEKGLLEVIE